MKTLAELFAIANEINAAAKVEIAAILLPPGSVANVCDDNGSLDSETSEVEGTVRLSIDIERWSENARTYTDAGRAELAAEESAAARVLAVAAKHGRVEVDGSGSGQNGPITCYILA